MAQFTEIIAPSVKLFDLDYILNSTHTIPKCDVCNSIIKPDVVLYGESLNMSIIDESVSYIIDADVLIVAGTSLVVYPAAGLIDYFKGKHLILINRASTLYDKRADMVIHDNIASVLNSILWKINGLSQNYKKLQSNSSNWELIVKIWKLMLISHSKST